MLPPIDATRWNTASSTRGREPTDRGRHLVDERPQPRRGQGDVELVRWAERVDRLGVALSVAPELGAARRVVGHGRVANGRELGHRGGQFVGGIGGRRHLDEQVDRVLFGERRGEAQAVAHQVEACGQEQLDRIERGHLRP
jgi:hypothetical protein